MRQRRVNLQLEGAVNSAARAIRAIAYRIRRKAAALALLSLTVPVGYKAIYGTHGWIAYHQEKAVSRKLEAESLDLQSKNQKLNENIKGLKTDRNAIEREAREQLHYARPGDVIITVPQPARTTSPTTETAKR